MLPFKSIDNDPGPAAVGAARDLEETASLFTMVVTTTGSPLPSAGSVDLEGSLDGMNWLTLASITINSGQSIFAVTSTGNDHRVRYIRANLSGLSGGAFTTATAWITA